MTEEGPRGPQAHAKPVSHWHRHPRHGATTTPASSPRGRQECSRSMRPTRHDERRMGTSRLPQQESHGLRPRGWSPRPPRCSSAFSWSPRPADHHYLRQRRRPTERQRAATRAATPLATGGRRGASRTIPTKFCRALGYAGPLDHDMQVKACDRFTVAVHGDLRRVRWISTAPKRSVLWKG